VSVEPSWSVTEVEPGGFAVAGEVDAHSAPMVADRLFGFDGTTLVLDLSGVTFIDSSGLRVIVQLHQRELEGGPVLEITRPSPAVGRLFEIGGFAGLLRISDDA